MKILVIEDNPANMKLASSLLRTKGYQVLEASNASSGIMLAEQQLPDLILMDIQLPGMDGLAATGLLKSKPETKCIPIIALTAFAMQGDEKKMLAAGCDGYISKPIRYKEFLAMIETFLGKGGKQNE